MWELKRVTLKNNNKKTIFLRKMVSGKIFKNVKSAVIIRAL